MSASPADRTPGRTPGRTPNGGPTPVMRRPKIADPLVRPKDKQKRRPQRPPQVNGQPTSQLNGMKPPPLGHSQSIPRHSGRPAPPPIPTSIFASQPSSENAVSGWSSKPLGQVTDYPLILSKKQIMDGFRHHVARFASRRPVDPRNTDEFVRPVRLHRRDPRAPPPGSEVKGEDTVMSGMDALDEKEKEKEEILRAEREAKKEAEAALVAPSINLGGQKKLGGNVKKTEQVYKNDQTEEQKARSKLRYEEALPWHLEDFDNKSTWVGTYEAALSDTYAMLVQGPDKAFRMVPLEKWYKFTQKNQFKTLTIEEAEVRFNKKIKEPRWFMDSEENRKRRQEQESNKKASSKLFLGKWEKGGGGSGSAAPITKNENADADDLDFTEDRFADDEENMLFEEQEDEETKEAEQRIKKDQLQANVFDLKEEKEYEKQEDLEKKEKEEEKKLGKHVKKALMKHEKNYIYDSDSMDNPYSSESESDSSESENAKDAEKAKNEAPNKTTPDKNDKSDSKNPLSKSKSHDGTGSGASSKGNTTPSHRPSKHPSPNPGLPRTASSTSLKRPGSPLASDASGNESAARKKIKKKHTAPSQNPLKPPSRPDSPPISNPAPPSTSTPHISRQSSTISVTTASLPQKRTHNTSAGSGSDSEGRAGSGGEMSDGTRKRIKLKLGMPKSKQTSPNGSTTNSRAGSPDSAAASFSNNNNTTAPTTAAAPPPPTSTAAPAAASTSSAPPTRPSSPPFPTAEDVRAHIPPQGIKMGELLAHFRGQIVGEERRGRFTRLMRENSRFVKETKMLVPLGE